MQLNLMFETIHLGLYITKQPPMTSKQPHNWPQIYVLWPMLISTK